MFGSLDEPGLLAWYKAAGAEQRLAKGWTVPPDLLPFVVEGVTFQELKEQADGFADEG